MLLLIAVCAVIVMASVIDDHSAALKKQISLIPQKGFYYIGILQSDSLPEQGKMVAGIKAALASRGYREKIISGLTFFLLMVMRKNLMPRLKISSKIKKI